MATFTVNDILGVGFKYEQTAEDQLSPTPTGTSAAIFGTATWGPINTPIQITGGRRDFRNRFGSAGTTADDGWDAAYYHFANSSIGYFIRIASSSNPPTRSYKEASNNATRATLTGTSTLGTSLRIYPSGASAGRANNLFPFTIRHKKSDMTNFEDISTSINFQTEGFSSVGATISDNYSVSGSYTTGDYISFKVYNESGTLVNTYTFTATGGEVVTGAQSFVNLLLTNSTINSANGTHFTLSANGAAVTLTTEPYYYGANAKIEITHNDFGIISGVDTGLDVGRSQIINVINNKFRALNSTVLGSTLGLIYDDFSFAAINLTNNIVLTSPTTGSTAKITITALNTLLGFTNNQANEGVNNKVIGSFRSKRRGTEGNLIRLVFSNTSSATEPRCDVYFRSTLVASIIGYNFITGDVNNLSEIFKASSTLSSILEYNHGRSYESFDEDDDSLSTGTPLTNITSSDVIGDGEYILTGGANGDTNIDVLNDVIPQIKKMSNEDIYDFDIIAAPGYSEQSVQKALIEDICEYRKDCFTVLDMPDFGNPTTAIDNAINWTNGKYISRTEKLDSIYGAVYFPWIKIRKLSYNLDMSTNSDLTDSSPVSRVMGMISRCDYVAGNKFSAPAGITRGNLDGVEGLKQTLSAEERDRIYADVYDNCINPIMYTLSNGFFANGQKTALRKNARGNLTSLSRINVMRVGLFIKKEVSRIVPFFFHEPNDSRSQKDFVAILTNILSGLVNRRAIEDNYTVICDESTNPPEVTNNNGLIAQIEFTPIKTIERIKLIANVKEKKSTVTIA